MGEKYREEERVVLRRGEGKKIEFYILAGIY